MKSKNTSKNKSQTPDTANKPIDEQIKEKRQKLLEVSASLSIYMQQHHSPKTVAKVRELQDRLEFRTKKYEAQLLDEKIGIYQECLELVKPQIITQ